jgi:UDP-N-acetylglucosamine transferase subunit ALG13
VKTETDMDDFTKKLQKSQSRDLIDSRAEELIKQFGENQHKPLRKRLIKFIFNVPASQHQLLPFYSRFTAIICRSYPEIA